MRHSRHTYGTRLGETGADAFTIMRLMGHSTVTVSQRYVHPSPEAMDNAVTRMETWSASKLREVGTNLAADSKATENTQVI
jgi:integrase